MSTSKPDRQPRETAPQRAAALTCCTKAKAPYLRHAGVEDEISSALSTPPEDWPRGSWRLETLAHLIRLRQHDNDPHVLGLLTYEFLRRAKPIGDRWSQGFGVADTEDIQIRVANRLGDLLVQAVPSRTSEYLEVDAATVIKQVTLGAIGPDRPKVGDFQSGDRDDAGHHTVTVERLADEGADPEEQLILKAEADAGGAMRYLDAVTDPRHREAFVLRHLYGWPLKTGPAGAPTLCDRFKKSDRQIRNWIDIAIQQMRAAHGAEA